jgi:plasmid stability protein
VPRTTIDLDEDILRQLKQRAAAEGRTLQAVVNELLRQSLRKHRRRETFKLAIQGWRATPQPGVDLLDRDKLFDLMNGR